MTLFAVVTEVTHNLTASNAVTPVWNWETISYVANSVLAIIAVITLAVSLWNSRATSKSLANFEHAIKLFTAPVLSYANTEIIYNQEPNDVGRLKPFGINVSFVNKSTVALQIKSTNFQVFHGEKALGILDRTLGAGVQKVLAAGQIYNHSSMSQEIEDIIPFTRSFEDPTLNYKVIVRISVLNETEEYEYILANAVYFNIGDIPEDDTWVVLPIEERMRPI